MVLSNETPLVRQLTVQDDMPPFPIRLPIRIPAVMASGAPLRMRFVQASLDSGSLRSGDACTRRSGCVHGAQGVGVPPAAGKAGDAAGVGVATRKPALSRDTNSCTL